ncbi:hypothetical protein COMA2_10123 [Candidatus Nitrospira nitrificans]|uniref:Uncharacterized protein n=1 Tax=Candidatus Nitrospira nitrificans TaxID=1742973 RepID=A0A0S4L6R6_9BACT|nr:hypothetical protein COMA2_10123 [Candidatus Nitrospira nitrificans]
MFPPQIVTWRPTDYRIGHPIPDLEADALEPTVLRRAYFRMLKKAVQQGRSERRGEAYASVRLASERCENAAGGLFQHPVRILRTLRP